MLDDLKNRQAYNDVLDELPPSRPDDPEYMAYYRGWQNISDAAAGKESGYDE